MQENAGTVSAENNYYGSTPYTSRPSVCAATSDPGILLYDPPYPQIYDQNSATFKEKFGPSWSSLKSNYKNFTCPMANNPDAPMACTHCQDPS
jgi:hypothetical protein